jgi:hypothetical protein
MHPSEAEKLKKFAVTLFKKTAEDQQVEQILPLFKPYADADAIAEAEAVDVVEAFLRGTTGQIPDYKEIFAEAELKLLGEVTEDEDVVHVVYRAILPRPQLISCRREKGKWFMLLNGDMTRLIEAVERMEHFKKKGRDETEALELAAKVRLKGVDVLGHVPDGQETAQVVCRTVMELDDYAFTQMGVYPIRSGEPAWTILKSGDERALAAALKQKWDKLR